MFLKNVKKKNPISMLLRKMLPESQGLCRRSPGYLFAIKMYLSGLMLLQIMSLYVGMSL